MSVFFITLSIFTFCFSTVNDLCQSALFCRSYKLKVLFEHEDFGFPSVINLAVSSRQRVATIFDYIDYICIVWFTIEFVIKCYVSPNKIKFFKSPLTWIDLLANIWSYLDLIYNFFIFSESFDTHPAWDLFGTIRIMRLFKLFSHFPGLRIIIASLEASAGVFKLLVFFIGVAVIIFASLIFYSEKLAASSYEGRDGMDGLIVSDHSHHGPQYNSFYSIIEAIW